MPANTQRIAQLRGLIKLLLLIGLLGLGLMIFGGGSDPAGEMETANVQQVDTSLLTPGEWMSVNWNGRPILILYRDGAMLQAIEKPVSPLYDPESRLSIQPADARNAYRSIGPQWLVVVNQSPDTGCPLQIADDGFVDSCRKSRYDWAGRVLEDQPSRRNLEVVPHKILQETIELGRE